VTRAALRAGYIAQPTTRDPAWYSDIRDLIDEYAGAGRVDPAVAADLRTGLARAERHGLAGRDLAATVHLAQVAARAATRIPDDGARDAVLRVTVALTALLALA